MVQVSSSLFKEDFLLLYCDNYIPDDEVIKKQLNASIGVTLLLHKREIGNISIKDNLLSVYGTKERKTKNPYVELGFISVRSVEFKNTLNKFSLVQKFASNIKYKHDKNKL